MKRLYRLTDSPCLLIFSPGMHKGRMILVSWSIIHPYLAAFSNHRFSLDALSFSDFSADTNPAIRAWREWKDHALMFTVWTNPEIPTAAQQESSFPLGYRFIPTGWYGISSMVCLPGKQFPIFVPLWASISWHWWRLGRMRGWFASGLTKHAFTITPFIPVCVFFGTSPWSLDLASKNAETDLLRNTLNITARATKLFNIATINTIAGH